MFGLDNLRDEKKTYVPTSIERCLADICSGPFVGPEKLHSSIFVKVYWFCKPWPSFHTKQFSKFDCQNCRLLSQVNVSIEVNVGIILQQKNLLQKICLQVMRILDARHPKIFSQLDTHIDCNNPQNAKSHKTLIIQKIVTTFLSIRFKHYCEEFKRFKTVHFQGQ